jgi:hypothetical protein
MRPDLGFDLVLGNGGCDEFGRDGPLDEYFLHGKNSNPVNMQEATLGSAAGRRPEGGAWESLWEGRLFFG